MAALIIYESMFGNTRAVAEAIASSMGHGSRAVRVGAVTAEDVQGAELLVVGAPTHAFGLPRPQTRTEAAEQAQQSAGTLTFERGADGPGLREWLRTADVAGRLAAAFDTRVHVPVPTPHAASKIAKALRERGAEIVLPPRSFFVNKENALLTDQLSQARDFGRQLAYLHVPAPRG